VTRWLWLVALAWVAGCSGLEEGESIPIELRVTSPSNLTIDVGGQAQLSAQAFNTNGEVVDAPITWRSADPTVTVGESTGLVTAVSPGLGRVQAATGTLSSNFVQFTVQARADTLVIVGDSIVTVPVEPGLTPPLVVRLESFDPAGPLPNRPVFYQITRPVAGDAPVVVLSGDVQGATVATGSDGTATGIQLGRVTGTPPPDTAVVEVSATRTGGSVVPGSGQRFIVVFE
jgi:hypothetical protein